MNQRFEFPLEKSMALRNAGHADLRFGRHTELASLSVAPTTIGLRHKPAIPDRRAGNVYPGYTVPRYRIGEAVRILRRCGLDARSALHDAGIPLESLRQDGFTVTRGQATTLLRAVWQATDDELLGTGRQPVPRETSRLLAYALAAAPDLRTALRRLEEVLPALPGIPTARLTSGNRVTTLAFDCGEGGEFAHTLADLLLAVTYRSAQWATHSPVRLLRVDVSRPRPSGMTDYGALFNAPISYAAAIPMLVFESCSLASPILVDHEEVEQFLANLPSGLLFRHDFAASLTDKVRRILVDSIGGPWPGADVVAARVAMSRQTLRRRLREEDTSLTEIKENVLRDTAIASLTAGDETVAALSQRLGFSEPSAFTRAFRRWTGEPPSRYESGDDTREAALQVAGLVPKVI